MSIIPCQGDMSSLSGPADVFGAGEASAAMRPGEALAATK